MQKYIIFLICIVFFITGCYKQEQIKISQDVKQISQDSISYIISDFKLDILQSKKLLQQYLKLWYAPWTDMEINKNINDVFWAKNSLLKNLGYAENLQRYSLEYTSNIYYDMNINSYPNANIKAIIVNEANVRAVPTEMPRFNTSSDYPFDQWQNSIAFPGTPVLVTHLDNTRRWAHIQTNFVYGWVKIEDIAYVNDDQIFQLMNTKNYLIPKVDKILLYDNDSVFVTVARVGQIFGVIKKENGFHDVYGFHRLSDGKLKIVSIKAFDSDFESFPKQFTPRGMGQVINTMIGHKYGWGGYLGNRDCSAFIRDSFANFALYLPRNSRAQAMYADNMVDLSNMKRKEKEKYILENATPFSTVLWFNGHIMLYIGEYQGHVIVAHSAWGVKTRKGFRKITNMLGGVVISTLYVGKKNDGIFSHNLLIDKILGMSDLYSYMVKLN